MFLVSESTALVEDNIIEKNLVYGLDIRDPAVPTVRRNRILGNTFQVRLERVMRRHWE